MQHSAQQGDNRTGVQAARERGARMVEATEEFLPSSPGTATAIAEVRVAYAREGESMGDRGQGGLLMDKLGERLAFERAGARLYETLVSKHEAYGTFPGGPSADELLHILDEEYEHADLLQQAIMDLGGDPTTLTPSANLAANISAGLPHVLSDPRTNLLQSLEAIVVAELADNECWPVLEALARQAGHDDLAEGCLEAIEHERDHLRHVRTWIAAGQGRAGAPAAGAEPPPAGDTEFTFSEDSPVDAEGYVVSEEERGQDAPADAGGKRSTPARAGKSRPGRRRS
jgi:hypothetical protein